MIKATFNGIPFTVDENGVTVTDAHRGLVELIRDQVSIFSTNSNRYYPTLESKVIAAMKQIGTIVIVSRTYAAADTDINMVY